MELLNKIVIGAVAVDSANWITLLMRCGNFATC